MKALFYLPSDPEYILPAITTVQCYRKEVKDLELHLYLPNRELEYLMEALVSGSGTAPVILTSRPKVQRGKYDLIYEFDEKIAYEIAAPTTRHVTEIFGVGIGIQPPIFPNLSNVPTPQIGVGLPVTDVVFLPFESSPVVREVLGAAGFSWHEVNGNANDVGVVHNFIANAQTVIGIRSFGTYLAASLGKNVVELYPDDRPMRWLSKWSCPGYQMIYGERYFTAEMIISALRTIWEGRRTFRVGKTPSRIQMEALISVAEHVGGLSAGSRAIVQYG